MGKKDIKKKYEEQAPRMWKKSPATLFRHSAQGKALEVCNEVFEKTADADPEKPFVITDELLEKWLKLGNDWTMQAGQQLNYLLHEVLQHSKHKERRKQGRGHYHHHFHRRKGWHGFLMNVGVAVVVVPLMLFFLRWHERSGGPSLF